VFLFKRVLAIDLIAVIGLTLRAMKRFKAILAFLLLANMTNAQNTVGVGQWQSMFPYNEAVAVAEGDGKVYYGQYGMVAYDLATGDKIIYTTVNGLSSSSIKLLSFNKATNSLVICYNNSNIDILQNGSFFNIPDLMLASVSGSKSINNIYMWNNKCILATDQGILYLNLDKQEIETSFPLVQNGIQAKVQDIVAINDSIYASSSLGLWRISANEKFPQEINNWTKIDTKKYTKLAEVNYNLYASIENEVYNLNSSNTSSIFTGRYDISDMLWKNNKLYTICNSISSGGVLYTLQQNGIASDSILGIGAYKMVHSAVTNNLYVADRGTGCFVLNAQNERSDIYVNGPIGTLAYRLRFANNTVYAPAGAADFALNFSYNRLGINYYQNLEWKSYSKQAGYQTFDSCLDILDVAYDAKNKKLYAPAYANGGLLEIDAENKIQLYKQGSGLDKAITGGDNSFAIGHVAVDNSNVVWMTTAYANTNLIAKDKDKWYKFSMPNNGASNVSGEITVDQTNQKWIVLPRGQGLCVYNDNGTISNKNDDKTRIFSSGEGNGNLASNDVFTAVVDKDNKIWVGTANGISIINCAEGATLNNCDAENKIVKYDIKADKLFIGESVRAIAVDGGNRKWVGTDNGLWLISADAEEIIHQFNTNNSPLPSKEIVSLCIDNNTGTVFIGTRGGIVTYRSDATAGQTQSSVQPIVFPNPVTANYYGPITINKLIDDGQVSIVDAAGQLVYKATANGGTLSWNGKTYTGDKPQSGIYFILVTTKDGVLKQRGSFTFIY
jgi:hypothetical protein